MNVLLPLGLAGALWITAAGCPLAVRGAVGLRLGCLASGVGGLACLVGGVALLVAGRPREAGWGGSSTVGGVTLRAIPLAAIFIALLGLVALAIGLYGPRYHRAGPGTSSYLAVYNLALVASLGVLVAGTVTTFLVAWESMALLSYLVVLRHHRRDGVPEGGFWFLALSEAGFALIVAAFVLLAVHTGSMDLATIAARAPHLSEGLRGTVFVLALVGFGFKAGVVPLHVWLPEAHPVAPADGSAFLSGMIVKLGIYGIVLFAFELLGTGPAWWGLLTAGLGAASAVLGILYALTERELKRFLAYSTIENIGVILIGVGVAMTFQSYGKSTIGTFLLLAALYHCANHGTYKTLLFLEAGVIEHATGTREMDRLGGLARRMPRTGTITLIGTLGISALPPLGGFVSEWLIFSGLFQGFRIPSHLVGVLIVTAAACLGLTGGLAINAFVRAFGIPFLGMPRTAAAADATETGQPICGPALLAIAGVFLGVGAPLVVTGLARALAATTGTDVLPQVLTTRLTILPAHTNFSAFSPTYLAVFLIAILTVPALVYLTGRHAPPTRRAPVWDGGIVKFKPRMQYSAMTFAAPVRVTFDTLYQPSVTISRASDDPAGRTGPVHYETHVTPLFHRWLYRPIVRLVEAIADLIRPIQSGDVNLYLLYVFLTVLVAYLLGAL
ncbi:proton-conducting transporter transmembrane domain-containing protein [Segeticoccus rhizosphaerae]|uniref:proton-conducting transporter transmembrane domain-containing protein n=1 Tax=Segeticoccus rhizosphaerae TaxID=1104777 RepID=UPI0010C0B37C|nr:proton-conducting transporter membrane subunit [Ornithinicoccus soli]